MTIRLKDKEISIVIGDAAPIEVFSIYRASDPDTLASLSGATVTAILYDPDGVAVWDTPRELSLNGDTYELTWEDDDFAAVGLYQLRIRVIHADTKVETLPYKIPISVTE